MPSSLLALPLVATVHAEPTTGELAGALAAALGPVWPALTPWLVAATLAGVIGVATEVVVRELQRAAPMPRHPRRDTHGSGAFRSTSR